MKRLLFILLLLPFLSFAYQLECTPEQAQCLMDRIELELSINPKYVWGGVNPLKGWTEEDKAIGAPGDCSGKLTAIFQNCGFLVHRVTALMMANAEGGWSLVEIGYKDGRRFSLVFFTLPPKPGKQLREHGHVGILIEDVQFGITRFAHSSLSQGFAVSVLEPGTYWYKHISKLRGFQK